MPTAKPRSGGGWDADGSGMSKIDAVLAMFVDSGVTRRAGNYLSAGWRVFTSCRRSSFAFDLSTMHHSACTRVERIAPVHRAAVVPQHDVADIPHVVPGEVAAR